MSEKSVWVVGTLDTKAEEIRFLRDVLAARSVPVRVVDLSTRDHAIAADIPASAIAADSGAAIFDAPDRGRAVSAMQAAFSRYCARHAATISGIIGVGGGGGTALVTAGMRKLPYGLPKVMVSTLASGDVAPYVGISDIVMVPSITDAAGLNRLSRVILTNAAMALAGMLAAPPASAESTNPSIGLTMFGVTTAAVTAVSDLLRDRVEPVVFHATGTGGRAMERLVAEAMLSGVIDLTLTEIPDLLVGGVLPCAETRLDVIAATGVPWVGAPGAVDMVNFWAPETIPAKFADRLFHHHNSNVTLMRTTVAENARIGAWIAAKLNACAGPVRLLLPERGLSALDIDGGAFFDSRADAALFEALESALVPTGNREITRLPLHINDPAFAEAVARAFIDLNRS